LPPVSATDSCAGTHLAKLGRWGIEAAWRRAKTFRLHPTS
jgi:hypothetical protein